MEMYVNGRQVSLGSPVWGAWDVRVDGQWIGCYSSELRAIGKALDYIAQTPVWVF